MLQRVTTGLLGRGGGWLPGKQAMLKVPGQGEESRGPAALGSTKQSDPVSWSVASGRMEVDGEL